MTCDHADAITAVLAESTPLMLEGIDRLVAAAPGFKVLSRCTTAGEALRAVQRHHPDVLLLDFHIRGGALPLLRQMAAEELGTRVVLLADSLGTDEVLEVTRLGVRGIFLKSMAGPMLLQCVRKVHGGATWIEKLSVGRALDTLFQQTKGDRRDALRLTRRELEILQMVAAGQPNREIAGKLGVREGTIKAHLHHVYEKLGVKGRLQLVLYVRDQGKGVRLSL